MWLTFYDGEADSYVPLQHGVNMETPLTTPDGFPRNDIDIAQSKDAILLSLREFV